MSETDKNARPKLLFLVTEDWYFISHRVPQVRAAQRAGFDVGVITNVKNHRAAIEALGCTVHDLKLERRSLNPFKALWHIFRIKRLYKTERPRVVHHIGMKPVLYGSLAAGPARVPCVINAFAGLGYVFSAETALANILRPFLLAMFRVLLRRRGSYLLLQNEDDKAALAQYGLVDGGRCAVIRGSGVDMAAFPASPLPDASSGFICVFAGRMIGIKGLPTLKEAFAILETEAPQVKLWLCGEPDPENPGSWRTAQLEAWQAGSKNVAWRGHCGDMASIWSQSHLALQPSYGGEGVPKALLEAAACGRAIVASDVPGCREVVANGKNGYLAPPHDSRALADRIKQLAADMTSCKAMGKESHKLIEERGLSADHVGALTEAFYKRCLAGL